MNDIEEPASSTALAPLGFLIALLVLAWALAGVLGWAVAGTPERKP